MKLYNENPVIYLSGGHTSITGKEERKWLKRTKCRFRCFSFGYTCPGAFYYSARQEKSLNISIKAGVGIMMDSGAFSFHKFVTSSSGKLSKGKKQHFTQVDELKDETIEKYIEYVKKHSKEWDFYVNFDYIKHAPTVYKVQKQLEKAGIRPVPVYHGDMDLDFFERYCKEGYKLIGIGTSRVEGRMTWEGTRYYYSQIFEIAEKYGVNLHGFAVTSLTHMFEWPWYSVDSATWVKTAAYGKIAYINMNKGIIGQLHVSTKPTKFDPSYSKLPPAGRKFIQQQVEANGFSMKSVRENLWERSTYNACIFTKHLPELKELIRSKKVNWGNIEWLS